MRYVWLPPTDRQTLRVSGKTITRGQAFDAPEAWAAQQPAGWVVPEEQFVAQAQAEQRVADERRARREQPSRVHDMETSVEETRVPAASPDDPELAELNGEDPAEAPAEALPKARKGKGA